MLSYPTSMRTWTLSSLTPDHISSRAWPVGTVSGKSSFSTANPAALACIRNSSIPESIWSGGSEWKCMNPSGSSGVCSGAERQSWRRQRVIQHRVVTGAASEQEPGKHEGWQTVPNVIVLRNWIYHYEVQNRDNLGNASGRARTHCQKSARRVPIEVGHRRLATPLRGCRRAWRWCSERRLSLFGLR